MRLTCGQCGRGYGGSDASGGHCTGETSAAFALRPAVAGSQFDASIHQTPVDDGWIAPDRLGYLCRADSGPVQRDSNRQPLLTSMLTGMVDRAERSQVLWSVIGSIPVHVVNVLSVGDGSVEHSMLVGFDVGEFADSPAQSNVTVGRDVPLSRTVRYLLAGDEGADCPAAPLPLTAGAVSTLWRTRNVDAARRTRLRGTDHAVILLVRALCHQSFTSNAAADRHHTGPFDGPLLIRRRCRTPAEMLADGWRQTRNGDWTPYPPRPWGPGAASSAGAGR